MNSQRPNFFKKLTISDIYKFVFIRAYLQFFNKGCTSFFDGDASSTTRWQVHDVTNFANQLLAKIQASRVTILTLG